MPNQFFFVLYAHSVYQCTLNVLISFIQWSTLRLYWHCFLIIHQFTSHTVSLTWKEACAVETWYMPECLHGHWENNDLNVFMGWYSMVYYLSNTVCVFYFPGSWWGWLAGVFYQKPESLKCLWNLNHVDEFDLYFSLCCWSVLSPEVYLVMFSLYCYVWRSKLSLGTQPA